MNKILRVGLSSFSFRLFNMAAVFLFTIMGAAYFGPEQFGVYTYIVTVVTLLSIPVKAGLPQLLVREVAVYFQNNNINSLVMIRRYAAKIVFAMSLITMPLGAFLVMGSGTYRAGDIWSLVLGLILIPLLALNSTRSALLQGSRKILPAQFPEMIFIPVFMIFITLLFVRNGNVESFYLIVSHLAAALGGLCIGGWILKKAGFPNGRVKVKKEQARAWTESLLPLSLLSGIQVLNGVADIFFVGLFNTADMVAVYKVAVQFSAAMTLPVVTISLVVSPYIASLYRQEKYEEMQRMVSFACIFSVVMSLGAIASVVFLAELIIDRALPLEYMSALTPIYILCFSNLAFAVFGPVLTVANMIGLEREAAKAAMAGALLNVLLCLALIPFYSIYGAAVATAAAMLTWKAILVFRVYKASGVICFIRPRIAM